MAMLAERKRKQKWSLNPRGKDWSEDSNKFGQKLLEKMGWSHGKGLGANENGITEHIKISYKNDSKGMGFKETNDQWTEHETNFSALLESLKGDDSSGDSKDSVEIKRSLEEKSQTSRARVHYHKFTRGKDLSRYSEKDLANIFGRKSLKKEKIENACQQEEVEEKKSNFTFNGGSMADYFKKKLPNFGKNNGLVIGNNGVLKKESESEGEERVGFGFSNGFVKNEPKDDEFSSNGFVKEESEDEERVGFGFGNKFSTNSEESAATVKTETFSFYSKESKTKKSTFVSYIKEEEVTETPKQKKKKRKIEEMDEEVATPKKKAKTTEDLDEEKTKKKKKKKNKEKIEEANLGVSNPAFDPLHGTVKVDKHSLTTIEENVVEENEEILDKKKKKKQIMEDLDRIEVCLNENEESVTEENAEVKKKKKKKQKNASENVGIEEKIEETYEVKTKKKKKKQMNGIDNPNLSLNCSSTETEETLEESANPYEIKPKKKKKKQMDGIDNPNLSLNCSSTETEQTLEEATNPYEVKPKKKKKKKAAEEGIDNPNLELNDTSMSQEESVVGEFEIKPKKKKGKKSEGLDNPCLKVDEEFKENLSMPQCDLMLNIVTTPILKTPTSTPKPVVKRRKSVRFSDVTQERIIPNNLELQQMTERNELFDINTKVITNALEEEAKKTGKAPKKFDMSEIDKVSFYEKPSKKRKRGLENEAFDEQSTNLEENIQSISKTIDTYQAEIENDINERKLKSVEMEDMMVGEVGPSNGVHEKLADGTKLKFKNVNFGKGYTFFDKAVGPKKSYKHLIKGDILVGFKNTNLHAIEGYASKK